MRGEADVNRLVVSPHEDESEKRDVWSDGFQKFTASEHYSALHRYCMILSEIHIVLIIFHPVFD